MFMSKKRLGASLRAMMSVALGAGAAITVTTATPAYAQDEEEQVIVTATRREQALQDVPVAVTPLTAEQLENAGVRDLQDLTAVAPTLQFNVSENESSATARLRGVGTQGSNPGLESAVGIFVDGVYRARNGVALGDLGEVSQVEVLRGPQGTLFGRNTSAGLISVVTAGPDLNEFGAGAEVTYGDFEETRVAGHITGPLIDDTLGFRLFAARSTRDGFMDVMDFNGNISDTNTRDMWTVRGQLLFAPSPNWDLRIIADYTERDEECCAAMIYDAERLNGTDVVFPVTTAANGAPPDDAPLVAPPGPGAAGAVSAQGGYGGGLGNIAANLANLGNGDIGNRLAFANRNYGQQIEDMGFSAELNVELGTWATLTSVTAYRDWQFNNSTDADYSAADLWYRPDGGDAGFGFEIFTQEVRLAGESGPVDWLLGVFYSDESLTRDENLTNGTQFNNFWRSNSGALFAAFDPTVGQSNDAIDTALDNSFLDDHYEQEGNSLALFGHAIAEFSPRTHLSLGIRFTHEEKDLTADFDTNFNGPFTSGGQLLYDAAPTIDATLAGAGAITAGDFLALRNSAGAAGMCSTDFTGQGAAAASVFMGNAQQVYCIGTMNPALDAQVFTQSREEEEFSGVIALHHELTDNVSLYSSLSRGYKGGGYNLDRNYDGYVQTGPNTFTISYDTAFDPEFVTAFEIGAKTTWFNGRLLANLALFQNEYENYQLNTFNGVSFQVASIPEVTSIGAEFDLFWRTPIDGLTLQGGFAAVEAEYGPDSGWVADSYNPYNRTLVLGRLPNNDLTNSPNWTVTGAATYERPIGPLTGLAYIDFRYVTDQITGSDLNPAKGQPEFWLVNARLGLGDPNERWSLELWARNLLDQDYQQIAFDVPLQSGSANSRHRNYGAFLGDPRTVGVTLRARY